MLQNQTDPLLEQEGGATLMETGLTGLVIYPVMDMERRRAEFIHTGRVIPVLWCPVRAWLCPAVRQSQVISD